MNSEYFDKIDTHNKAYWLGFLWCDGYITAQRPNGRPDPLVRLDLSEVDASHCEKLYNELELTNGIKHYKNRGYKSSNGVVRCIAYNRHLVETLQSYGIHKDRYDCTYLWSIIPDKFKLDFIRGVLDGDGSFSFYECIDCGRLAKKANLSFGGSEILLNIVENYLIEKEVIANMKRKLYRRHKDRDGCFRTLNLSGVKQALKVLDFIYDDAKIHLDRKYEKYYNYKVNNQ